MKGVKNTLLRNPYVRRYFFNLKSFNGAQALIIRVRNTILIYTCNENIDILLRSATDRFSHSPVNSSPSAISSNSRPAQVMELGMNLANAFASPALGAERWAGAAGIRWVRFS